MRTVRSSEADRVSALETGADDFMTRPFSTRAWAAAAFFRSVEMDLGTVRVMTDGREISLSPIEFRMLPAPDAPLDRGTLRDAG